MRSTIRSAVPTSASTSASMNSSPPTRPQTSPARSSSRDRGGDGAQRLVADRVARRVDRLEVVEVERDDRHRVAAALGAPQLVGQALLEGAVVEEPGQRILERLEQRVGHAVEVAREGADLVATAELGAGGVVPVAEAVGDRADAVEAADDGATEQQADEAAEHERGGDAEQREDRAVLGAGAVERGEVVVQLEHRVGADRIVDLGVVAVGVVDDAVVLRADVDRRGVAGRVVARLGDLRGAVDVVPRDRDLDQVRVAVVQPRTRCCISCGSASSLSVEAVLPGRRDRGQLGASGALVGVVERAGRHADHQPRQGRRTPPSTRAAMRGRRPVSGFRRRTWCYSADRADN